MDGNISRTGEAAADEEARAEAEKAGQSNEQETSGTEPGVCAEGGGIQTAEPIMQGRHCEQLQPQDEGCTSYSRTRGESVVGPAILDFRVPGVSRLDRCESSAGASGRVDMRGRQVEQSKRLKNEL